MSLRHPTRDEVEVAFLKRTHLLVGKAAPQPAPLLLKHAAGLNDAATATWSSLKVPPLVSIVDPEDSSQRRWLCPKHAKELSPPDTGNLFHYAQPQAVVDPGFLRWLRVGVALRATSQEIATLLAQRAGQWYTATLTPSAHELVQAEVQLEAAAKAAAEAEAARSASVAQLLAASVTAALQCVDEAVAGRGGGGGSVTPAPPLSKPLKLEECKKDSKWQQLVRSAHDPAQPDMAVMTAIFDMIPAASGTRFFIKAGALILLA